MDPTKEITWAQTPTSSLVPVSLITVNNEKYVIYGQQLSQLSAEYQDILDPPPPPPITPTQSSIASIDTPKKSKRVKM